MFLAPILYRTYNGGDGSYNSGMDQVNESGVKEGQGRVVITRILD